MSDHVIGIGQILKQARLAKNMSLDKVAAETKLAKSVILQLESEQFDRFPAPVYVMGFLENLADQVGLEKEPILQAYRDYLKSRDPDVPVPGEIERQAAPPPPAYKEPHDQPPPPSWPAFLGTPLRRISWAAGAVLLVVLVALALVLPGRFRESRRLITQENEVQTVTEYRMNGEKSTYDLSAGDTVKIFVKDGIKLFRLDAVNPDAISFTLDNRAWTLAPEQPLQVDAGGDPSPDLEVKLRKVSGDLAIVAFTLLGYKEDAVDYAAIFTNQEHVALGKEKILFAQQEKYPVTIFLRATQPCHIEYTIDGKRQNSTTLSTGSATLLKADEHIELVMGNWRALEMVINKVPVDLNGPTDRFGLTKVVQWVRDARNETRYDLVVKDLAR